MSPSKANKESAKTTRQRAAEARAKAEAEAKRRDNRNRAIGIGLVVVLIALIFGGVWFARKDNASTTPDAVPSAAPNPDAAIPTGVDKATWGVPIGTGTDSVPQLQIWEDFQCPICGELETQIGKDIEALAQAGTIRLLYRPANIIEGNFGNTYSQQSFAAWGCAIDAGKTLEYHNTVFANQPATEGAGWTQQQLLQFGKDSGITGDAYSTFEQCVTSQKYAEWAANSFQAFHDDGITGTPTGILVLGDRKEELKSNQWVNQTTGAFDIDLLKTAITDFAKG